LNKQKDPQASLATLFKYTEMLEREEAANKNRIDFPMPGEMSKALLDGDGSLVSALDILGQSREPSFHASRDKHPIEARPLVTYL
jgi:hypothetical protein